MLFRKSTTQRRALETKIALLEKRLHIATEYLRKISEGDHDLSLLNEGNGQDENNDEFLLTLRKTKERLKEYTKVEQERIWAAEGMSKFMEIMQGDRSKSDFYDTVLTAVIRYCGAIQGGIFLLNNEDESDPFLELKACYAYSRKKFIDKRIPIGHGMLGQCFLEKETNVFTSVPERYFDITSGLGEATPRFLLIVPMKYDQNVMGVLEIASFEKMPQYKVSFIEKIAENLASVVLNIQHSIKATKLYEESQLRAKRLQEQEEALRQNIEELEATQEEMRRHQIELDQRSYLMKFIIDNIPFPIFVKDERGRYTLVNKSEAKLFNLNDSELIGKDDSFFVQSQEEWQVIKESDEKVLESDEPLELPAQRFTTDAGSSYVFKTTKIPFVNGITGKKNILGVSIDLTEKHELESKLTHERDINHVSTLINLAGRQRMLTQKIAFYAELVSKGKTEHLPTLKLAVDLYDHSLKVMINGGLPPEIESDDVLPKADPTLVPYIESTERLWKPYKEAAKNIIHHLTFGRPAELSKTADIQENLSFLEENAEALLERNNDLMLVCLKINERRESQIIENEPETVSS